MPIIVDEVVISVEVSNLSAGGAGPASAPSPTQDRQQVVEECVERVLQVLREREEER
jgi:hypothetical protein